MNKAYHVRIDHVTQGPDGQESRADRLSIRSDDFLWLYVESELPSAAQPKGEYQEMNGAKMSLGAPTLVRGQYRFSVIHYVLSPQSEYVFHFADNLSAPRYDDHWTIKTV